MIIVVAGKGGVGKTFISALLIRRLSELRKGNILAIDADPNSNLNLLLDLNFKQSLADVVEELKKPTTQPGLSKPEYLKLRFQEVIVEAMDFDLLVMGRPEGEGCYCAVNNLLREMITKFSKHYHYTIVDSTAGLEHLSRKTTGKIDTLLLISEPDIISLQAVLRAQQIAGELNFQIKKIIYIINKVKSTLPDKLKEFLTSKHITNFYTLTYSEDLDLIYESGRSIYDFNDGKCLSNIDIIINKEILNL